MNIAMIGSGHFAIAESIYMCRSGNVHVLQTEPFNKHVMTIDKNLGICDTDIKMEYDLLSVVESADIIFINIDIPYDIELNSYDMQEFDMYIGKIMLYSPSVPVVIRNHIPIGYTRRLIQRYPQLDVAVVPDFIRKESAIEDEFNSDHLIIGGGSTLLQETIISIIGNNRKLLRTGYEEAESIKLFLNTYLALRIAFFNEIDTFAELRGLDSKAIINALSFDKRVGDKYNNPSFGYGGKYLTESTCRLKNEFADIPETIIDNIRNANNVRKKHVVKRILERKPSVVGIFSFDTRTGIKDFQYSPLTDIIKLLQIEEVRVILYEPEIGLDRFMSADVINDFESFAKESDVIIANRYNDILLPYRYKVYCRDAFKIVEGNI